MKFHRTRIVLLFLGIALITSGCIGVNREFKNIRSQILDNLEDDFDRQIEFSVGPVGFFIASRQSANVNIHVVIAEIGEIAGEIGFGFNFFSGFKPPFN